MSLRAALAACLAAATLAAPAAAHSTAQGVRATPSAATVRSVHVREGESGCVGDPKKVKDTFPILGLNGRYVTPAGPPTQLAVFAHGYQNSSASWTPHLLDAAKAGQPRYPGAGPRPE